MLENAEFKARSADGKRLDELILDNVHAHVRDLK